MPRVGVTKLQAVSFPGYLSAMRSLGSGSEHWFSGEQVSTLHGKQNERACRIRFHLLPQTINVRLHGVCTGIWSVAPNLVQQLLTVYRQRLRSIENFQDRRFFRGQADAPLCGRSFNNFFPGEKM